jgi:hypothetical protein
LPTPDTALLRCDAQAAGEFTAFYQALAGFALLALVTLCVGGAIHKLTL